MAVTRRRPSAGLVHHSDRGSQYTSLAFGRTLRQSGLVASMGSRGDAFDNAACEAASRPSRSNGSSATATAAATKHGYRSSATSKRSTTRAAATRRSAASAPTNTSAVVKKDYRQGGSIQ